MKTLLPLLLLAGLARAEFSYQVQKSQLPEDASVTSGMIVVIDGGSTLNLDATAITGNGDGSSVIRIDFAYDTELTIGAVVEVGFLTVACGVATFQRSNETTYPYQPGAVSPVAFPLPGLIEDCETANQPSHPFGLEEVYPNPSTGSLQVSYGMEQQGPARLRLFDGLGEYRATIYSAQTNRGLHHLEYTLPPTLPMGLYHLVMESEEDSTAHTVVFQADGSSWNGAEIALTNDIGYCEIPAGLLAQDALVQMSDSTGASLGTGSSRIGIVLEKDGQVIGSCVVPATAAERPLSYRMTVETD